MDCHEFPDAAGAPVASERAMVTDMPVSPIRDSRGAPLPARIGTSGYRCRARQGNDFRWRY